MKNKFLIFVIALLIIFSGCCKKRSKTTEIKEAEKTAEIKTREKKLTSPINDIIDEEIKKISSNNISDHEKKWLTALTEIKLMKNDYKSQKRHFIYLISNEDFELEVTQLLKEDKNGRVLQLLINELNPNSDSGTRELAATASRITKDPRAVGPLKYLLQDEYISVREAAAQTLGIIGDPSAIDDLVLTLKKDNRISVRWEAAHALEKMGWEPRDEVERAYYLIAINQLDKLSKPGQNVINSLISDVNKIPAANYIGEEDVVTIALLAISELKLKEAVEPTIKLLQNSKIDKWLIAKALGEFGDTTAVKPLVSLLESNSYITRSEASWALENISGKGGSYWFKYLKNLENININDLMLEIKKEIPFEQQKEMSTENKIDIYFGTLEEKLWNWIQKVKRIIPDFSLEKLNKGDEIKIKPDLEESGEKFLLRFLSSWTFVYSPDKSHIILYSFGNRGGDVDSDVWLGGLESKRFIRFLFCGPGCVFDDVFWVSNNIFVISGWFEDPDITPENKLYYRPELFIYDLSNLTFSRYRGPAFEYTDALRMIIEIDN